MALLSKVQQKIFGDDAATTDFGQIGSEAAGAATNTKDLATIQSLTQYDNGLTAITNAGSEPPRFEDINSMYYMLTSQIAYGFQSGIPEWDTDTEYYEDVSIVNRSGILYQALTGEDGTPNTGNDPSGDTTNWGALQINLLGVGKSLDSGYALDVGGKLKIVKGDSGATPSSGANIAVFESDGNSGISILVPDTFTARIFLGTVSDNSSATLAYSNTLNSLNMGTSILGGITLLESGNSIEFLRGDSSQRVYIGYGNSGATADTIADDLVVESGDATAGGATIATLDDAYGYLSFASLTDPVGAFIRHKQSTAIMGIGTAETDGTIIFYSGAVTEAMQIDGSQRVGIGITPSGAKLEVSNGDAYRGVIEATPGYATGKFYSAFRAVPSTIASQVDYSGLFMGALSESSSVISAGCVYATAGEYYPASTSAAMIVFEDGVIKFNTNDSLTAGTLFSANNAMVIDTNQYILMGLASDVSSDILQVDGNISMRGSSDVDRYVKFASDASIMWDESQDAFYFNKTISLYDGSTDADGTIQFASDASILWDESEDAFYFNKPIVSELSGYIHESSYTDGEIFDELDSIIPTIGDIKGIDGTYIGTSDTYEFNRMYRYSTTQIQLFGANITTDQADSVLITDGSTTSCKASLSW